ncbi:fructose-1,6-bisphosphatase/inositol monophosphatase family enzyme [Azospirillum agricola]|uniref:inositol monophosphatase family protein n=1 Tax=Azospirillum agricola TaxID=1720247 RepID=UPI001AE4B025|nr:inositol monophosphatase family protein [Azospirillum agricola]MBP2227607.1 fructose-1,6-bisphosphatase/inositol monophosphatase family enzyme [Azospirillum agricola]
MTRFAQPDIDRVSDLIRSVAKAEILPWFRNLAADGIRQKTGPMDLVTLADEAAERALTPALADLLPGSRVIGEEAASENPRVLDRLQGDDPVWIIDPVDGTLNFAEGRPLFAVIVALAQKGETIAGWIHDPIDGRMATAVKGEGAWLDGRRARVADAVPLPDMVGALSTRFCGEAMAARLEERSAGLGERVCLSSAAQEYLRLLEGRAHYSLYHRLMPWDHAAGVLLHAEAGGHAALVGGTADGVPYRPTALNGSLLLAPDAESWRALHGRLFG